MHQYKTLLKDILYSGESRGDRTGTGTKSVFGKHLTFNLKNGFPIVSIKRTWFKGVCHELIWMLSGSTNIKYLTENDVNIWNEWADDDGNLGPVYGNQWRNWRGPVVHAEKDETLDVIHMEHEVIDQIAVAIDQIKNNPTSRRIIVNAWDVGRLPEMALPPCHMFFQFYVSKGKLSCQMYQRSADCFLGVPFNIASYSLLTHMMAQVCGLDVGVFHYCIGDAHIYNNHIDQVAEIINRDTKPKPTLVLNKGIKRIEDFRYKDIGLVGYDPHPPVEGKVSV